MDALRDHPLTREAIQRNRLKVCFALHDAPSQLVESKRLVGRRELGVTFQ